MVSVDQLLAGLLQGVNAALVGGELSLEGLVLLHFALQVGGILRGRKKKKKELRSKDEIKDVAMFIYESYALS